MKKIIAYVAPFLLTGAVNAQEVPTEYRKGSEEYATLEVVAVNVLQNGVRSKPQRNNTSGKTLNLFSRDYMTAEGDSLVVQVYDNDSNRTLSNGDNIFIGPRLDLPPRDERVAFVGPSYEVQDSSMRIRPSDMNSNILIMMYENPEWVKGGERNDLVRKIRRLTYKQSQDEIAELRRLKEISRMDRK